MQMTCPKCHGEMRMYERSGVTIDQCTECRGIFLDRGELDKLFEAEATWNRRQQPPPATVPQPGSVPPASPPPPAYGEPADDYGDHGHYRNRRRSFLNELFD
jgi:Zn-finger nucleic acid-binding protein